MLNTQAPEFILEASTGQKIRLQDLLGTYVVLIFYPMNDTPICNRQLNDMNVSTHDLMECNARVFGVNTAASAKHREYCVRQRLEFPILSDPGGSTAKNYKAWMRWLPISKRTVVVIDPAGVICFYKRGTPSSKEIVRVIKERQEAAIAP